MTENLIPQQEIRIAIRFITTNVPGEPRDRLRRVAGDFAQSKLSRVFNSDSDFFHWPPDFYLTTSKRVWMLCDFNIRGKVLRVDAVPVQWWSVSYDQNQSPSVICPSTFAYCPDILDRTFKEHQMNGKLFTNRLPWGGRDNEWEYRLQQRREALTTGGLG